MSTHTIEATDLAHARGLLERAASLRAQADQLVPVLATSYRRRAAELEFEAFLLELHAGIEELDTVPLGA